MSIIVQYLLMTLLGITSVFLILLVLVQRGRGGGLAGAFGGAGGQSAFGTRAGDVFTRVTIVVATFWIILCAASIKMLSTSSSPLSAGGAPPAPVDQRFGAQGKPESGGEGEKSPSAESAAGGKPAVEAPAGGAPTGEGAVSAAPPAAPKAPAAEGPAASLPAGSLTPNGSVAPQTPLPESGAPAGEPKK